MSSFQAVNLQVRGPAYAIIASAHALGSNCGIAGNDPGYHPEVRFRECPHCQGVVQTDSVPDEGGIPCPRCGKTIRIGPGPAAVPRTSLYGGLTYWMGNSFVVPPGGAIPDDACVICCGEPGATLRAATFRYMPAGRMVGCTVPVLLLSMLLGHAHLSLPEKVVVQVPVCHPCWRRWRVVSALWAIMIVLGFVPAIVGLEFFLAGRYGEGSMIWGVLGGIFGWPLLGYATRRLVVGRFALLSRGCDVRGIHLHPPHPAKLRRVWGIEGEPPPPPAIGRPARRQPRRH